jgi:hypothetical protein
MRLYRYIEPHVVRLLSKAISKIHISFDGWTTKGGKRGFFGIIAHFADAAGIVRDLPLAIPQLTGAHTGIRIAEVVAEILRRFGVSASTVGYFILDNAAANNAAVAHLANKYGFDAAHRRLRCAPHTLNLVGQMIMFGVDGDAYNNSTEEIATEDLYMREWRKDGPLGVLIDIVNYIRTPTQHDRFKDAQRASNSFPHANTDKYLEPVKPVVTRWNSYFNAFERAVTLKDAIDKYAADHIDRQYGDDARARGRNKQLPDAPAWMRSDGLRAADWAVITEYIEALRPLKEATDSLQARGKTGGFGAIYEVVPQFEAILKLYETVIEQYEDVDFSHNGAPEDHLAINLRAAWKKLDCYYGKLDASPVYYAACCLHPYYKNYCSNSWRDKPDWIAQNDAALQQLWASYKPPSPEKPRPKQPRMSSLRDTITALVNVEPAGDDDTTQYDQLQRWRRFEPAWTVTQFEQGGNPVSYWVGIRSRYPELAQLAIDVLTIPASSCDCERLFSELGDLLEPRRRNIGSNLMAAIQCIKSWRAAGFTPLETAATELAMETVSDAEIERMYEIASWDFEN